MELTQLNCLYGENNLKKMVVYFFKKNLSKVEKLFKKKNQNLEKIIGKKEVEISLSKNYLDFYAPLGGNLLNIHEKL